MEGSVSVSVQQIITDPDPVTPKSCGSESGTQANRRYIRNFVKGPIQLKIKNMLRFFLQNSRLLKGFGGTLPLFLNLFLH
jgi:hypothetical protein